MADTTTTTMLWTLYRSTVLAKLEDFVGAQFYHPHALADDN